MAAIESRTGDRYRTTWRPGTWPAPWRHISVIALYLPLILLLAFSGFIDGLKEGHHELIRAWHVRSGKLPYRPPGAPSGSAKC